MRVDCTLFLVAVQKLIESATASGKIGPVWWKGHRGDLKSARFSPLK